MIEEEERERKKQEDEQKRNQPSFNPNSYAKGLNSVTSKFKK